MRALERLRHRLSESSKRYPLSSYILVTTALMVALYVGLYHPYATGSVPGRLLQWYLAEVARLSSASLNLAGEQTQLQGTSVFGRFSFVVVVDCAALDAQALFTAAVLAFPATLGRRLVGLALGLPCIFLLNVARLIALYFAGASSMDLFHWLHEQVFVLLIIALVCGLFATWAFWAKWSQPHDHGELVSRRHAT